VSVRDFGPLAKAEVELRPLTVFAGPSNTGKSWLATLIYALERHFNSDPLEGFGSALRRLFDFRRRGSPSFPENPAAWLESIRQDRAMPLTDSDKKVLADAFRDGRAGLAEELLRCYGLSELRHHVREGSGKAASVTVSDDAATRSLATRYSCKVTQEGRLSLGVTVADGWVLPSGVHPNRKRRLLEEIAGYIGDKDEKSKEIPSFLLRELFSFMFQEKNVRGFYLPADRGGVMHAHQVVVGALIRDASRAGLTRSAPLPTLSGILADFLQNLIEITDESRSRYLRRSDRQEPGSDHDRADLLERNVLQGKIAVERSDVGYPRFSYSPDGWDRTLPFTNVSSMTSELAPVALYLRHYVRKGDLLILEEPEAHLHPGMQVAFVREIAEWVRQGIRVLLTTHSEWVLEELANIVAAGEADRPEGLPEEDVGLWLFEPEKHPGRGATVRKILWDPDEGGFEADFEDVAMALYNKWANLMNRLS